jgi:hypothetical protein
LHTPYERNRRVFEVLVEMDSEEGGEWQLNHMKQLHEWKNRAGERGISELEFPVAVDDLVAAGQVEQHTCRPDDGPQISWWEPKSDDFLESEEEV